MHDKHCHILPGVDDGSPDLETSVKMLKAAQAAGITRITATPHLYEVKESYLNAVHRAFEQLKPEASALGIPLDLGFEVNYAVLADQPLDSLKRFAANNRLLLELPTGYPFPGQTELLKQLAELYKLTIAHPERYAYWNPADTQYNILVSATSLSSGLFSPITRKGKKLLKAGNPLASDAHTPEDYKWVKSVLLAFPPKRGEGAP